MDFPDQEPRVITGGRGTRHPRSGLRIGLISLVVVFFVLLIGANWGASLLIDYSWWKELGQVKTWIDLYAYSTLPIAFATFVTWIILLIAHARGVKFAGGRVSDYPVYSRISSLVLLALSFFVADASIDNWTVLRFAGSRALKNTTGFQDPIFGKPVTFYLFDLPFWSDLRGFIFAVVILSIIVYWLTARGWQLRFTMPEIVRGPLDLSLLRLSGGLESRFLRGALAFFLVALAARYYLGRFEMVWNQHRFMVGVDYTDDHFALPLYWVVIAALIIGAGLVVARRWIATAVVVVGSLLVLWIVPSIAGSLYVKPNEISLERPYIQTHIEATRAAFGLSDRTREIEMHTDPNATIDTSKHKPLLDNVRLWDWKPFHDTVMQLQALRPYYTFHEPPDVDRYTIDGQYRQVLLSSRELDITQLPGTQSSWINPHFIYTHGYGLVMAEVSKITPDGQPVYLIQDMPPEVKTPSLKITRPEFYYGEFQHEPVFVDTAQEEFDYPKGSDNAKTRYAGKGGFPISSLVMRAAAALHFSDSNIVLTGYLTDHSRMMIHRTRARTAAGDGALSHVGYGSLHRRYTRRPAGMDARWLHGFRYASFLAGDRGLWRDQLHAQCRESYCRCLRRRYAYLHLRFERPGDRVLPVALPFPVRRCVGHAGDAARAYPLCRRSCSACSPTCTACITCAIRSRSTTTRMCGSWRNILQVRARSRSRSAPLTFSPRCPARASLSFCS